MSCYAKYAASNFIQRIEFRKISLPVIVFAIDVCGRWAPTENYLNVQSVAKTFVLPMKRLRQTIFYALSNIWIYFIRSSMNRYPSKTRIGIKRRSEHRVYMYELRCFKEDYKASSLRDMFRRRKWWNGFAKGMGRPKNSYYIILFSSKERTKIEIFLCIYEIIEMAM